MKNYRAHLMVCAGTGCVSNRSFDVRKAIEAEVERQGLADEVRVVSTGCNGFCAQGPIVVVHPDGVFYRRVRVEDAAELVEEHLLKGRPLTRLLYTPADEETPLPRLEDIGFFKHQRLIALRNRGLIDPENIDEYIGRDGYRAMGQALSTMTPEEVIAQVKDAGLRGRGGGGFPTGVKWGLARKSPGRVKFIVCNADEGDPGAFMDRSIIEADPHSIIEGMAIGAYAIGASHGYVYVRAEYPLALERLQVALEQAKAYGLLGQDILGLGFDFALHIRRGGGAFVCGEETSLMASIMGRTGEPVQRPPFPSEAGLWGQPTNINNVETWANVPPILLHGADWFSSIGTERSKGTKVFSLVGKINNTGLIEVPMGIPLRDIIFEIGGGIPDGNKFKAVQTGGPSGGCIPESLLDLPVDFDELQKVGSIMGSGGMIVMDETTCMVDLARYFLDFLRDESCGKCTPCREGVDRMLAIVTDICEGRGREGDIELLEALAYSVKDFALCGLGQTAPNPVLSTLRYFRHEYEAHIRDKTCPAGACKRLTPAPCQSTCPIGQDVASYVALLAQGRTAEAAASIREDNPLPLTLGRVCVHRCEDACKRGDIDAPVRICSLKRFAVDHDRAGLRRPAAKLAEPTGKKVAVVGAGPAGLTVAHDLARLGHGCTVFEALPEPGGMLRVGIPEYRLPRDVLAAEVGLIEKLGVEIRCDTAVGRDVTLADLRASFDAVFLGLGAHQGLRLGVPGEADLKGVVDCTTLLRERNLGRLASPPGDRVVVIGGGNAAMDAVRTAVRLGCSSVTIAYRRTEAEMPANRAEIAAAREEGVAMEFLVSPVAVQGEGGRVTGLALIRNELGEPDRSGRRRPVPVEGSEFVLPCDAVVPAISQEADLACLGEGHGYAVTRWNSLEVDPTTLQTNQEGVFAGGDCVTGPATVVEAVAAGQRAAVSMDCYLRGAPFAGYKHPRPRAQVSRVKLTKEDESLTRPPMPELDVGCRTRCFDEVELGLDEETARKEARRCLRCDL